MSGTGSSDLAKRLLLLLCSMLVGLLLVEGALRVRQWIRHGTVKNTVHEFAIDPESNLRIPQPLRDSGRIKTDSRGFRNPELDQPKPAGRIRLAFLGGSTTFCAEASSNENTWPHLAWESLSAAYPEAEFDYVNASLPGGSVEESLINLRVRVAPVEPDVIVVYHATNDLSHDTRMLAAQQGIFRAGGEEPGLLARWSLSWYLLEKNLRLRQRQKASTAASGRLRFQPDRLARGFEDRLVELLGASRGVARLATVATFSHKVRRDQPTAEQLKNCDTSLYYMPYMTVEGLLDGFDAYNRAIRRAAERSGAVVIEGEETIPGDDRHFNDSVHFTDAGSHLMANRIVDALRNSAEFRVLVESAAASRPAGLSQSGGPVQ